MSWHHYLNYQLPLFLLGEGEFGQRSIVDHAVEYLECARQHPHLFKTPKVMWVIFFLIIL
jgi:hypothetical protein